MGSSSSAGGRRRVAVVVDAIAETQQLYESAVASSLGETCTLFLIKPFGSDTPTSSSAREPTTRR